MGCTWRKFLWEGGLSWRPPLFVDGGKGTLEFVSVSFLWLL